MNGSGDRIVLAPIDSHTTNPPTGGPAKPNTPIAAITRQSLAARVVRRSASISVTAITPSAPAIATVRVCQSVRSRLYLLGSNSPMLTISGPLAPGTITRALRS